MEDTQLPAENLLAAKKLKIHSVWLSHLINILQCLDVCLAFDRFLAFYSKAQRKE